MLNRAGFACRPPLRWPLHAVHRQQPSSGCCLAL